MKEMRRLLIDDIVDSTPSSLLRIQNQKRPDSLMNQIAVLDVVMCE
jgi:hypothetical protein